MANCGDCRFSGPFELRTLGGQVSALEGILTCRLNPPVSIVEYTFDKPSQKWAFPTIHPDEWCSKFQGKD